MPLMECGHTSQTEDSNGNPVCVICVGITERATKMKSDTPDLEGREAKCTCGKKVPSKVGLAFFRSTPKAEYDNFYCGCRGWD